MQGSRPLLRRLGSGRALTLSMPLSALTLVGVAVAPGYLELILAAAAFGMAVGLFDISMNAQGAVVENASGRSLMSGFHAGLVDRGHRGGGPRHRRDPAGPVVPRPSDPGGAGERAGGGGAGADVPARSRRGRGRRGGTAAAATRRLPARRGGLRGLHDRGHGRRLERPLPARRARRARVAGRARLSAVRRGHAGRPAGRRPAAQTLRRRRLPAVRRHRGGAVVRRDDHGSRRGGGPGRAAVSPGWRWPP